MRSARPISTFVDPTANWAGRIRSHSLWVWLVSTVWAPLYSVFWHWVLNFPGKLLYLRSSYARFNDPELAKQAIKILHNDPHFVSFARLLHDKVKPEWIEQEKQQLLRRNDDSSYSVNFFGYLDEETREEIIHFALAPQTLEYVLGYMKMVPRLEKPQLVLTIPRSDLPEEGSKLWHRDSFHYKTVKFMICINDIDDTAGPNYVVGQDVLPLHAEVPKPVLDPSLSDWNRRRLSDKDLSAFVDKSQVHKLTGSIGATSIQDAAVCYHKGGYCTEKDRVILQIDYITDDGSSPPEPVRTWADTSRPTIAPLLRDPVHRYILGELTGIKPLLRKLRFYGLLRALYFRTMFFYVKPRTASAIHQRAGVADGLEHGG